MLANNPASFDRAEIECVLGNQYIRLPRQQHDLKALSASESTTTADHGEKKRRSRNRFEGELQLRKEGSPCCGLQERKEEDRKIRRCPRRQEGRR